MDDVDSMGPDLQPVIVRFSNFLLRKVSLQFILHGMSIFHDIQMATYFGTAWCYSHMVGYAGSPTRTVYVGVTLTRSKVKVNLSGLLNFRQLGSRACWRRWPQPPCGAFWYENCQRHSCSAVNCLSSGINILAGDSIVPLISERKGADPHWKHVRCTHFAL